MIQPVARKRGRPPIDHPAKSAVTVKLSTDLLAQLDCMRGGMPRSAWIREAVIEAIRRGGTRASGGESLDSRFWDVAEAIRRAAPP